MIQILDKWVKENIDEGLIVVADDHFYYDLIANKIGFAFNIDSHHDKDFVDFAYSLGLNYTCDAFILSFFHEVGHFFTVENEELDPYWPEYIAHANEWQPIKYYQYPVEKIATQWAVDYINNNIEVIKSLCGELEKCM